MSRLRGLLARAWYPFLGRFGRPTRIQEDAIPAVLAGENVLLASATATGKTEAYAAPLVERLLREKWRAPSVIVISPTRALANDLFRRLETPMAALKVSLQRKTGDHSEWDDAAPPQVVVTTPESLDSLLSRRPETLKNVRAVVLDELHVLDGTARGDQLAVLVTRLERLALGSAAGAAARGHAMPLPLQRVGATATAAFLEGVAARYLGRSARVVATDERREIEADFVEGSSGPAVMGYLARRCGGSGPRKVLVFANSRADAENLAAACKGRPPFGQDVFVHHASLARGERERVEKRFLGAPSALCVATMTLELGIDIGDIDLVGLVGPPHDVASLLQRVGRGNRRSWDVTRVACFYEGTGQLARFQHMLECARRGALLPGVDTFRPSVLVQQAWSLAFQNRNRFVEARAFADRLPVWLREDYPAERLEELLSHLAREGWMEALAGGRYGPSARLEKLYERGMIHSNISRDVAELEVVDAVTERVVGYLPMKRGQDASSLSGDLVLGGQRRSIRKIAGKQVRTEATPSTGGADFAGQGSPSVSYGMAQSFREFLGIPEGRLKTFVRGPRVYMAHFLGSSYGRLFMECVQRLGGGRAASGNAFVAVFAGDAVPELEFREGDVLKEISKHRRTLSSALQDGPLSPKLPANWWHAWLCEALDVPRFLTMVDTLMVDMEVDRDLERLLASLGPALA